MDYVESQFKKGTSMDNASESEMINMLSGNGGSQVDLVLYVIHHRKLSLDFIDTLLI